MRESSILDELHKAHLHARSGIHPKKALGDGRESEGSRVGIVKEQLQLRGQIDEWSLQLEVARDNLQRCRDARADCVSQEKYVKKLERNIGSSTGGCATSTQDGRFGQGLKQKYVEMDMIEQSKKDGEADEEMARVWAEAKVKQARSKIMKDEKEGVVEG